MLQPFSISAPNYCSIDEGLHLEDPCTDIIELTTEFTKEQNPSDDAVDCDDNVSVSDGEEDATTEAGSETLNNFESLVAIGKLKKYFINKSDAEGLKMISELQVHVESRILNERKKQSKITNFFVQN
jgi:hypothetical protein